VVKELELKRRHAALITVCLVVIISAALVAMQPRADTTPDIQFPTGVPHALGGVTSTRIGEIEHPYTISVSGSGSASAKANKASVTLGVQTQHASASEAVEENAEAMANIMEALKDIGLSEEDLKTVAYSVYPVYSQGNTDYVTGYRVVNMIQVDLEEINMAGEVIDTAISAGANRINGIAFGLSSDKVAELELQAYEAALDHAATKAELIAEQLGVTLTGVVYVAESAYYPYSPYRGYGLEGASTPIIEGSLSVSVTVHVVYSFQ